MGWLERFRANKAVAQAAAMGPDLHEAIYEEMVRGITSQVAFNRVSRLVYLSIAPARIKEGKTHLELMAEVYDRARLAVRESDNGNGREGADFSRFHPWDSICRHLNQSLYFDQYGGATHTCLDCGEEIA